MESVSPALQRYGDEVLENQLWQRPDLSPRERSIVTLAALIARNQTVEMPYYINRALDSEVTPAEVSEIITHLAFYTGWPSAMSAVEAAKPVFAARDIGTEALPSAQPELLPIDEEFESARRTRIETTHGTTGQGVQRFTTDVLFTELWLRPDLPPRDRSLITVSALVASGLTGQITSHLNTAMDKGLTQIQADEVLTQLAFYSGWPYVFTAMPIFKQVFEARSR
ncbi:carboxymuconolactone decarboxylase family protein [Mycolicibacterium frederiksbergense]|uniref:carboxymuconolactone decarboxylase family protein n=1 Tax=Mycolicibacterium frederiksbergense TaxID=117567 RepID=UPI0021F31068|nr:carboxymuconolactone decarboxylase family protein [Mycolicibacterium frederiksbergense]